MARKLLILTLTLTLRERRLLLCNDQLGCRCRNVVTIIMMVIMMAEIIYCSERGCQSLRVNQ